MMVQQQPTPVWYALSFPSTLNLIRVHSHVVIDAASYSSIAGTAMSQLHEATQRTLAVLRAEKDAVQQQRDIAVASLSQLRVEKEAAQRTFQQDRAAFREGCCPAAARCGSFGRVPM